MKIISILILFFFSFGISSAQSSFSARLISVTAHPFAKENLSWHQNKIDKLGYLTFEPGLILSYDKYLIKKFSLRISTSAMKDRFNGVSGYSQIILKLKALKQFKHYLFLGLGPSVFYETNKFNNPNYTNEENFNLSNNTIYKFFWLSGMIEYNYYVSKKMDLALTLNHIHPHSIALTVGIRFELPDPNGKGCDCPSFR